MRRTVSSLTTISVLSLVGLHAGDASAVIVGPDTFGYRAVDQASGAVYNYIDITATGDLLFANADEALSAPVDLGAPFTFYGNTVLEFTASSNGFIADTILPGQTDFGNDCPLPVPPAGGGARIAPLHDDLLTAAYYQYFDEGQAAALGYPGETAGISVFQWEGTYFAQPNSSVDAEAILFHDNGAILSMVAAASQGGSGSTTGIQNSAANIGVSYTCNSPGSISGGITAVLFTPPPVVSINEVRVDQTGTDFDEYFELAGPPGASLDGLSYVVIGDGGGASGTVELVQSLNGQTIPASGYFVVAEDIFTLGTPNLETPLNFENDDTTTHLLARTFTGFNGQDLDVNNDGALDTTPWFSVSDAIALIDQGDLDNDPYGPGAACVAGTFCNSLTAQAANVGHAFRCIDAVGIWNEGTFNVAAVPNSDSPGEPNPCACGDGLLVIGEVCDAGGEAVMCDDDCTVPLCGDSNANETAGEICDTGGNSATCDVDCTAIACNDGVFNDQAEACDDFGESATCDDDCTAPSCGDGNVNEAAGETCDDSGESATCDDDCTAVACGDDTVNEMAGETCDDGGRSGMCDADCTAATCGDGNVNMTAGEECDGDGNGTPGETATCDDDCTTAVCGDMVANALAGETCDAGDEADDCDDDCSAVECGDGNTNEAADEECDDGNTDDGDGCSATCTDEGEPGTSSGGEESSSGGESEGSSTSEDPTNATGDTSATDPDSSGTDPDTSGSASVTDSDSDSDSDEDGDTEGDEESSGGSGNITPDDDGCGCNTTDGRDLTASLLAFFGLGALRRRRRKV